MTLEQAQALLAGVSGVDALKVRGAAEGSITSFPSGVGPGGSQDLFLDLRPVFGMEVGQDFAIELGATFRLRVFDDPPAQRDGDIGGVLRRADWDEPSDFGQIVHKLRIGKSDSLFRVQLGAVKKKTLGLGHLISRYSNQDNPDYHPASGDVAFAYEAIRAEVFASDLFGARIFAGEVAADMGRIISSNPDYSDRFHLALSLAHDFASAGNATALPASAAPAPVVPVDRTATVFQMDFDAALYRNEAVKLMAFTGFGTRFVQVPDLGVDLGVAVDATLEKSFSIGGKVSVRKQNGKYRQGFFGPGYEIARFSGSGFTEVPRALEVLPDSFSLYVEARVASGETFSLDGSLEYFGFGRTDIDVLFSLNIIDNRFITGARFTATGLGSSGYDPQTVLPNPGPPRLVSVPARLAFSAEARLRIFSSFYVLGSGGTVFIPQPNGNLAGGIYFGAGAGGDFELKR